MSRLPRLTPRQAEAAVERSGDSLALTSGAGCGKTLVLARRFTELVMRTAGSGQSPFERFVALTFTDKAALEMAARVREVLLEGLRQSRSDEDRQRLADWITELPVAHISTIHSFCAWLLRRHAIEAGVDPDFAVCADELVTAQMQADAADQAVLAAAAERREDVLELLARAELRRVVGDVMTLMSHRIAWEDQDCSDPDATLARWRGVRERLRREALAALSGDAAARDELNYLTAYPCSDPADRLLAYREEKLAVIARMLQRPESVAAEDVASLKDKPGGIGGAKAWGGKDARKQFRDRLRDFVGRFAALSVWFEDLGGADAEAARCLATLTALAREAIGRYDRAKRGQGLLDFDDLILRTRRLLRENASVRSGLRKKFSQMLIDECQDTDPHQLEMLWGILTDGESPPPGKIFIVGDVKQSIYRFRGAQAEVFERLCGRFGKARIPLTETFRAHGAGVGLINHVFSRLMGDGYEEIVSSRRELPPGASVEILLADAGEQPNAEAVAVAQADVVAGRIAEIIGRGRTVFDHGKKQWRPARAGDVAILLARRTNSLAYERALRQRGVAYYVVAGTGFFRQQEVYDVLNALRAIDNPFDDVALFGALRSAMFGLNDNVLLHVALAASPPYFQRLAAPEVLAHLAAPQREQLRFARDLLGRLHRGKDALGAAGLIETLLSQTGYAAALLSQFHGRRKLANVYRLLESARSAQSAGRMTLADFVQRYGELVLAESRYEQAAVAGEAEDVVRIMTIHKAKGLEFPVVVVPDLNAGRMGPRGPLLFRRDWGIAYKPPGLVEDDDGGDAAGEPLSYRLAKQAERDELAAEDVRKLYVAVTRHQDHLILVGADWRDRDGRFRDSGSYLAQLDGVLDVAGALERGADRIGYGDGFFARLARITPSAPSRGGGRRRPIGRKMAAAAADASRLADALTRAGKAGELALVGPLPEAGPAGRIAATALVDFAHCPMLYRWRHELRVPVDVLAGGGAGPPSGKLLDAATAGTVFHRCMELVNFDCLRSPRAGEVAAHARSLVGRALAERELSVDPAELAGELTEMLGRLAEHPLLGELCGAGRRLRELSFLFRGPGLDVSGKIDLLYQDAGGDWHVVDYKSDRLAAADVGARAARYELQMMMYAAAAAGHLGQNVADATVYFLRPGRGHSFAVGGAALAGLARRLGELAKNLTRSRRTGRFARRPSGGGAEPCAGCACAGLCGRASQAGRSDV